MTTSDDSSPYCSKYFTPETTERLEAAAFRSLRQHLQERSDVLSNMELMTVSGFCRNCLAKWMVLAARDMADELDACVDDNNNDASSSVSSIVAALDQFSYAEAAEHVYGMQYDQWKKRYQKKATDEEMKRYTESQSIHAQHDKDRLGQRQSNVCCEPTPLPKKRVSPYTYPGRPLSFGVLTVSDRAFQGAYETGDLSGPAMVEALRSLTSNIETIEVAIVPDDKEPIQAQLQSWTNTLDIVFTTGGTGFGRRDVTPEATREILDAEWQAVMILSKANVLSRGTAGFRGNTVIVNLPGNPQAAKEILPELLPVVWKATLELQEDVTGIQSN